MTIEAFADCCASQSGGDVGIIVDGCRKIGPDGIRALVAAGAAAGLGAWLSRIGLAALEAYIGAALGVTVWEALLLLINAVGWGILIDVFIHCVDLL